MEGTNEEEVSAAEPAEPVEPAEPEPEHSHHIHTFTLPIEMLQGFMNMPIYHVNTM